MNQTTITMTIMKTIYNNNSNAKIQYAIHNNHEYNNNSNAKIQYTIHNNNVYNNNELSTMTMNNWTVDQWGWNSSKM